MTDPSRDEAAVPPDVVARPDGEAALARLERIVEALLFAADQPLSLDALLRLLAEELGITRSDLRQALARLDARLQGGAVELCEVASGWRIQVREEHADWVARLWQEKPPRFSRALLETLALIVYRQPITRGEIEDVRGVSVSTNILRTLQERGWVREIGVKEVPGRPALFGTTPQFLDDFNLRSLDQLPSLPEVRDIDQLDAALAQLAGTMPPAGDEDEGEREPLPATAEPVSALTTAPAAGAGAEASTGPATEPAPEPRTDSGSRAVSPPDADADADPRSGPEPDGGPDSGADSLADSESAAAPGGDSGHPERAPAAAPPEATPHLDTPAESSAQQEP